jgi:hypothetical protein
VRIEGPPKKSGRFIETRRVGKRNGLKKKRPASYEAGRLSLERLRREATLTKN